MIGKVDIDAATRRLLEAGYWRAENKHGDVAWISPYQMDWRMSFNFALEELDEMEAR